jgi:hypothetical protein
MGLKYLKEYNSFTEDQIRKGLKKSISNKDIDIKTNIDNVIDNINQYNFKIGSIESFLYDNDDNFIAESVPDKLIKYVKDNNLDIDISKLIEYNNYKKQYYKISDDISMLNYSYSDDKESELTKLYLKEEELEKYLDLVKKEVLKIKKEILNKKPIL